MKKISMVIVTILMAFSLNAAVIFSANPPADKVMVPLFNTGKTISLNKFMTLKPKEYKELTGSRMSFKERIELKLFQHKFKTAINNDGTVNLQKFHQSESDSMASHHIGWLALGLLFGLIALIVALFIKDDYHKERINWILAGWAAWVAILLIISASVL